MTQRLPDCSDDQLTALIRGDGAVALDELWLEHIETCADCQHRLTELAATEDNWQRAAAALSADPVEQTNCGGVEPLWAPEPSQWDTSRVAWDESMVTRLLDPPSHPELLGRLGRYDVERKIGAGGMGVVFKGFDSDLNRPVAIKVLAEHLASNGSARARFARESRAAAAVVHEHVVSIHDVESDGDIPFLVMQYVAGESLHDKVDREGPLQEEQILRIAIQAAAGLAAAHEQGVIHRDIKPANILLENGSQQTLLTDFGLARTVDDASLTCSGVIAGTPHYMSPEQANGEHVDHRTDLFSFGSVLYFMATGRPPFRADRAIGVLHRICQHPHRPVCDVNPDIHDHLSDLIDDLLEKKTGRRPNTAFQVRQRLCEQLAACQNGCRRSWRSKIRRALRRHPTAIPRTIIAIVVATLMVVMLLREPHPPDSLDESAQEQPQVGGASSAQSDDLAHIMEAEQDAMEAVIESLWQAEQSQSTKDARHDDSLWSREVQSIHESLNRLHEGVLPKSLN